MHLSNAFIAGTPPPITTEKNKGLMASLTRRNLSLSVLCGGTVRVFLANLAQGEGQASFDVKVSAAQCSFRAKKNSTAN